MTSVVFFFPALELMAKYNSEYRRQYDVQWKPVSTVGCPMCFLKICLNFPIIFSKSVLTRLLENNRMTTKKEISKSNLSGVLNLGWHSPTGNAVNPLLQFWKAHNRNRIIRKNNTSFYLKLYHSQWHLKQKLKMISLVF